MRKWGSESEESELEVWAWKEQWIGTLSTSVGVLGDRGSFLKGQC